MVKQTKNNQFGEVFAIGSEFLESLKAVRSARVRESHGRKTIKAIKIRTFRARTRWLQQERNGMQQENGLHPAASAAHIARVREARTICCGGRGQSKLDDPSTKETPLPCTRGKNPP